MCDVYILCDFIKFCNLNCFCKLKRRIFYFLYGVEFWVIEVFEELKDFWFEDFFEEEDE